MVRELPRLRAVRPYRHLAQNETRAPPVLHSTARGTPNFTICWAEGEDDARKTVREIRPTAGLSGQLSKDLPTWSHFEDATEPLTIEQVTETIPCGPDSVERLAGTVQEYIDTGYDHVYFHQVGHDQDGFFRFWDRELQSAVAGL